MNIASFIEACLKQLSKSGRKIAYPSETNHLERVRKAIENANSKVSILIDDTEFSAEDLAQMKIAMPDAFKEKPVHYECVASQDLGGGFKQMICFGIEVIN
jgi:hypothetical protein